MISIIFIAIFILGIYIGIVMGSKTTDDRWSANACSLNKLKYEGEEYKVFFESDIIISTRMKKYQLFYSGLPDKRNACNSDYYCGTGIGHKKYCQWLLYVIISWLQDKPKELDDLINFMPQADRQAFKDLLRGESK